MDPYDYPTPLQSTEAERIRETAAGWLARLDRGLDEAEETEFLEWLTSNPAHSDAFERQRRNWKRLDTLVEWCPEHADTPNPDLLAPGKHSVRTWSRWLSLAGLGIAAAVTLVWWIPDRGEPIESERNASIATVPEEPEPQTVPDGSVLFAKGVAEFQLAFSDEERCVRLDAGEVFFRVAKDPDRPFVVVARGLRLKAVGTAFNVRIDNDSIELLVEEGKVVLEIPSSESLQTLNLVTDGPEIRLLEARQRAIVQLDQPMGRLQPQIDSLSSNELKRVIAWQQRMLQFNNQPLGDIIEEFNRLNDVQMVLEDESLGNIEISGTMHSSNIAGFTRLLAVGFGIDSEAADTFSIMLFDPLAKKN